MKGKKILALALSAVMLMSLMGLAMAETKVEKILIYVGKGEIVDDFKSLTDLYKQETGVSVEMVSAAGEDGGALLRNYLTADNSLTIFTTSPGANAKTFDAFIADMSDLPVVQEISKGALDAVTSEDGKLQGIPFTVEGYGFVYNKDLVDPAKITDLASFTTYMEEAKAKGVDGLMLSAENYFLIVHMLALPFAMQDDPEAFTASVVNGEVQLRDVEAFQEWAKFYDVIRKNAVADPLTTSYDQATGAFATGKTGLLHQGNWAFSMFADYDVTFEMGLMPVPILGNDRISASVPGMWVVNPNATAEEQKAAKDFINWMYTSETGKDYLYSKFQFIPLIDADLEKYGENLDPLSTAVQKFISDDKTVPFATAYFPSGIDVDLVAIAQGFFGDPNMTTDQLLDSITETFAEYN